MQTRREMARWAQEILAMVATGSAAVVGGAALAGCARDAGVGRSDPDDLAPETACRNPIPILSGAFDTGFEWCENGWEHRPRVVECPPYPPRDDAVCVGDPSEPGACRVDADCTVQPNGYCVAEYFEPGGLFCNCSYGCLKDAECPDGFVCRCSSAGGSCIQSSCTSDAACGSGHCATVAFAEYCGGEGRACQQTDDECMSDIDCENGLPCTYTGERRECWVQSCVIGRPFLVDGRARVACVIDGAAWVGALASLPGLPACEAERARLADYFTRSAQLEHASIAAFARFTLELLAFGAPPDLLRDAQRAMADETEHARMCFTLAGHYSGRALEPGRLLMTGTVVATSLADSVEAAIREGCVGETVAALDAAEASAAADDDVLRDVFAWIAADERRHAELAWRFVRWALAQGDAAVVERARTVFAEVGVEASGGTSAVGREAMRVVIRPAATVLLAA